MLFHKLLATTAAKRTAKKVEIVGLVNLLNQGADASHTLTLTGIRPGDAVLVMTGNRSGVGNLPTIPGYTSIVSAGSVTGRGLRLQIKTVASTSESVTWTGSYGYLLAVRNFWAVGSTNTRQDTTGAVTNTLTIPDLTGLAGAGTSLIVAGGYASAGWSSSAAPYTLPTPTNNPGTRCVAVVAGNVATSLVGKTMYHDNGVYELAYAVELLG